MVLVWKTHMHSFIAILFIILNCMDKSSFQFYITEYIDVIITISTILVQLNAIQIKGG